MTTENRYKLFPVTRWQEMEQLFGPIPASPHALIIHLRTNQFTSQIPGLYGAGERALADGLKWSDRDFRRCFEQVRVAGLAEADWSARVVWIPSELFDENRPRNPNMVRGWRRLWMEMADCPLKERARVALRAWLISSRRASRVPKDGTPEQFAESFDYACPNKRANGSPNCSPNGSLSQDSGLRTQDSGTGDPPSPFRVLNGYGLQSRFSAAWSKVFPNALPWAIPPVALGKAETFAERITPEAVADIDPTMVLMCEGIRDGAEGWTDSRFRSSRAFAFGAWMNQFTDLREVLHGISKLVAKPPGGRASFDPSIPVPK